MAIAIATLIVVGESAGQRATGRDERNAIIAGIAATTTAPSTITGFARNAPNTSKWPTLTAAVVPPQNGHGNPVNVRNGHSVAGRPGTCRLANASAATAPTATR